MYTDYLSAHGFNVMAAANGLEALSLLHRVQAKLVLLDIMMPELNGIETCCRARLLIGYKTPIVFLTALDYVDHVKEGIEAGGDAYILKTSQLEEILERVKYWTGPRARGNSAERREKALENLHALARSPEPAAVASDSEDELDYGRTFSAIS